MTPDDAAQIAEEFLEEFVLDDAYATKLVGGEERERAIWVQQVEPHPGRIHVLFGLESEDFDDPQDPEVQQLAAAAVEALKKAHPELAGLGITFEFI